MTATKIENLWQSAREQANSSTIEEGDFRLHLLDPEYPFNIFAGMDSSGNILLAIEVNSRPPNINVETESLDYFRQQRIGGSWLMLLRLIDSTLEPVFGRLCQDLIDAAVTVPSQAALINLFKERLNLWKKLFQNGNNGCLEKHIIKGLMAELLALEDLLIKHPDSMAGSVIAWTGPQGADQDFIFGDQAIEIKAISSSSDKVGISSIGQLDALVPLELWVYVLKESCPEENDSICLMKLAIQIEGHLSALPKSLATFKEKLLEVGYVEHECYESSCFKVLDICKYYVSDDFPKLTQANISEGISDISYSLSIPAISPFRKPNEN